MVLGLLLAAGAGSRYGGPKALATDADGTSWLRRAVAVLHDGGCDGVRVVLGAGGEEAGRLLEGTGATLVQAPDWASGMSASLKAGLTSLAEDRPAEAALVHLVDLPDVGPEVVRRVLSQPYGRDTLRRASYDGRPGHPVLIGRDHWAPLADELSGDAGARAYLARNGVTGVECADLAAGTDVDERGR